MHLGNKKLSHSFQNQVINAVKFYYEVVLGLPNRFYHVDRPSKENKLPSVLGEEEVGGLSTRNLQDIKSIEKLKIKIW